MTPSNSPQTVSPSSTVSTMAHSHIPNILAISSKPFSLAQIQQSSLSLKESMHWLALENWLHHCQASLPIAQSLADVKGLIEANYHSCALQQWNLAYQLLCWPIGEHGKPLHEQLTLWGHYRLQIDLWTALKGKLDMAVELMCLNELGHAHRQLGEFSIAESYHQQQLETAQKVSNDYEVMRSWCGLGSIYSTQYRFRSAMPLFERQQVMAEACHATTYQIDALIIIGRMQMNFLGRKRNSFVRLNAALMLAQTCQNTLLEARALTSLGTYHLWYGDYAPALTCLQQAIASAGYKLLTAGDKILVLSDLGLAYANLGNIEAAIESLQAALYIARSGDLLRLEIGIFHDLSLIESQFRDDLKAGVEFAKKALSLAQSFGDFYLVLRVNASLSIFYAAQAERALAERYFQSVVEAYPEWVHEMQPSEKVHILACIAQVKWLRGEYASAFLLVAYSLILQPPWSHVNGRLVLKGAISTLIKRPSQKVLNWLQQHLQL